MQAAEQSQGEIEHGRPCVVPYLLKSMMNEPLSLQLFSQPGGES